jgi:hypothetical protein
MTTKFSIHLAPTQQRVYVNGIDLTDAVQEVHIHKDGPVAVPQVSLVLSADSVDLDGAGIVQSIEDQATAAADLVAALDPEQIEKAALEDEASMDTSVTAVILRIVEGVLRGSPT